MIPIGKHVPTPKHPRPHNTKPKGNDEKKECTAPSTAEAHEAPVREPLPSHMWKGKRETNYSPEPGTEGNP